MPDTLVQVFSLQNWELIFVNRGALAKDFYRPQCTDIKVILDVPHPPVPVHEKGAQAFRREVGAIMELYYLQPRHLDLSVVVPRNPIEEAIGDTIAANESQLVDGKCFDGIVQTVVLLAP